MVLSQGNTSYIYKADGQKVKKIFGAQTTDYLDGFQYQNGVLQFFPTSEGFYNVERQEYVFNYTDIARNKRNSDTENNHYFDHQLYKERYTIERTNAWLDSFRSILNRFDTTVTSWIGFNYLAFIVIALRKFEKRKSR